MITEDILITSKDLMKWLNREITEDDEELCMYLSNAVKNQYEYHKEIERLNNKIHDISVTLNETYNNRTELRNENNRLINIINELEKWLKENAKWEPYVYNGILDKINELKGE